MMFYVVVSLLAVCDLVFWWWADRQLRSLTRPRFWRIILGTLVGAQFVIMILWVVFPWTLRHFGWGFWIPMSAWVYMWHLLVLPITMSFLLVGWGCKWIGRGVVQLFPPAEGTKARRHEGEGEDKETRGQGDKEMTGSQLSTFNFQLSTPPSALSTQHSALSVSDPPASRRFSTRRQVLCAAAAFVPKAALAAGLIASYRQAGHFRVRPITVRLPQLPSALDGLTIAHVTDTHVGRFVREAQLDAVVRVTAGLKPDLVVFTGDLIDVNLADLPMAIHAMQRLAAIAPMAMCVGNHDLFEDGDKFRRYVLNAGLPLLCDQSMPLTLRGQRIEILGLDWGSFDYPRSTQIERHMGNLLSRQQGKGFSILLTHHPHAFDPAAAAGIPLTLAGHTHGGQLMLTEHLGFGNVFKYYSGAYQKADKRLVVSNGVGNWFPLRINAPAEIVHLTLARGP